MCLLNKLLEYLATYVCLSEMEEAGKGVVYESSVRCMEFLRVLAQAGQNGCQSFTVAQLYSNKEIEIEVISSHKTYT
jgi:hypothetical protein